MCNAIIADFRKNIEGKFVDAKDGYVEVRTRDTSRFVEREQARSMKFPRIVFHSDYAGVQFSKWPAHAVNNQFKVGSETGYWVRNASGALEKTYASKKHNNRHCHRGTLGSTARH